MIIIAVTGYKVGSEVEMMREDLGKRGITIFNVTVRRTVGFTKAALSRHPTRDVEGARAGHLLSEAKSWL